MVSIFGIPFPGIKDNDLVGIDETTGEPRRINQDGSYSLDPVDPDVPAAGGPTFVGPDVLVTGVTGPTGRDARQAVVHHYEALDRNLFRGFLPGGEDPDPPDWLKDAGKIALGIGVIIAVSAGARSQQ